MTMTDHQRIIADLDRLRPEITARDRVFICSITGYSAATVNNYLTGRGKNTDTAYDILIAAYQAIDIRRAKLTAQ